MGDVNLVKSIYTGGVVTSLGELAAADQAVIPGTAKVGSLAGFLFGTAGVVSAKNIADSRTALGFTEIGTTSNSTNSANLDCGSVTSGDRFLLMAFGIINGTALVTPYLYLSQGSGSATIVIVPQGLTGITLLQNPTATSAQGIISCLVQVTGSGTLVMNSALGVVGGSGLSYPLNTIYGYFLYKQ